MMAKVSDYFKINYGVSLEFNKMIPDETGIPFISRQAKNNGMVGRVRIVSDIEPNPANTISVAGGGSVMESFLQDEPYYSGRDLFYLTPKIPMTKAQMLYYCMCLRANNYKYNYGRQANKTLKDLQIPDIGNLPSFVDEVEIPKSPSNKPISNKKLDLNIEDWKWFKYEDIFNVEKCKGKTIEHYKVDGKTPLISSSNKNNGVSKFVDAEPLNKANSITINNNGSIGYAFYQNRDFLATTDVSKIFTQSLNIYIAMFLIPLIKLEIPKFNYGRKWNLEKMKKSTIKLPVDKNGNPDWQFMEEFIKSLPYSSSL